MRIAIVTTSWPAGPGDASGHFVQAEAAELERAGHEIVLVTPRVGYPGAAFGWPGAAARIAQRPLRAIDAARWVVAARARMRTIAVDRVIAHWAVPCGWPIAVAGRHVEVVSHGADVRLLLGLPAAMRDFVGRTIAERASTWRFVSEDLRRELVDALRPPARALVARIAVVRAASFEMPDVLEAGKQLRRSLDAGRIAVSIGRLVKTKRVDRAIDFVARSRDIAALVVVGEGPERARLERLARSRGVDARFVGLLPRDRALAWMAAADVVLHGSAKEGLSTVVREAQALGKPVLYV